MNLSIAYIAVVVRDYDDAKRYYTDVLGFQKTEDAPRENNQRWILLAPPGSSETRILLQKAITDDQILRIGNQTGGRVFLFLQTDDFERDYQEYLRRGVKFIESPREEEYGKVVKFEDLCGNRWYLLQLNQEFKTRRSNSRV